MEPVYYDPTDYFDIAQHEVDRQDELEYEVRAHYQHKLLSRKSAGSLRCLTPAIFFSRKWSCTSPASRINWD